MPKKEQPRRSYSTLFLMYSMPLLAIGGLIARFYNSDEDDTPEGALCNNTYLPVLSAALCPLLIASRNLWNNNNAEPTHTCLTPRYHIRPYKQLPGDFFASSTLKEFKDAMSINKFSITRQYHEYKNNIFHFKIIGIEFDFFLQIYNELSPEIVHTLTHALDVNKRTPFHLSLGVAAPGIVQKKLMTPDTVNRADKNGVTPLMLAAAGFMDEKTTKEMMQMIGENNMNAALNQKDHKGRDVSQYTSLSKAEIMEILTEFSIDGNKAYNHCTNAFSMYSQFRPICLHHAIITEEMKKEFNYTVQQDANAKVKEDYYCISATRYNLRKFKDLAHEKTPALSTLKETHRESYQWSKDDHDTVFKLHNKDAKHLLKQGISDVSTVEFIMKRQDAQRHLFTQEVKKKLKRG